MIIVTVVFLILVFSSVRIKKSPFNNDLYLEGYKPQNTNAVKGLLAIGILLSHFPKYEIRQLPFTAVSTIGSIGVGVFFFFSGYLLSISAKKKESFFVGFIPKKIIRIGVPFILLFAFSLIFKVFRREVLDFFSSFIYGHPYSNTWYVFAIIFFYICFYFCFRKCDFENKKGIANSLICLFLLIVLYTVLTAFVFKWGSWWYKTPLCFYIGIVFGLFKKDIEAFFKKYYFLSLLFSIFFCFVSYFLPAINNRFSLIPTDTNLIWILNESLMGISFTTLLMLIIYKLHFINPITVLLGKYSYEIYLWHGLIMEIMFVCIGENFNTLLSQEFFSISVLTITIIVAVLFNKLSSYIIKTKFVQRFIYGNV